jgi:hypothetical protein
MSALVGRRRASGEVRAVANPIRLSAYPIRFVRVPGPGIVGAGQSVGVLRIYPPLAATRLYSLAELVDFVCAHCAATCECALVGVLANTALICPGCYAAQIGISEATTQLRDGTGLCA